MPNGNTGGKLLEKKIFLPLIEDPEEFEFITIGFLKRDFMLHESTAGKN